MSNVIIKYVNKFSPDRISAIMVYDTAQRKEVLIEPIVDLNGDRGCFYEVPAHAAGQLLEHESHYALWSPEKLDVMVTGGHGTRERKTFLSSKIARPVSPESILAQAKSATTEPAKSVSLEPVKPAVKEK